MIAIAFPQTGQSGQFVTAGMDLSKEIMDRSLADARAAMQRLSDATVLTSQANQIDEETIVGYISDVLGSAGDIAIAPPAEPPESSELTASFPDAPEKPTIGSVTGMVLPEAPEYNLTAPVLLDIAMPTFDTFEIPEAPTILDIGQPLAPDFVLPDVPTLYSLDLPAVPSILIEPFAIELDGDRPLAPDISKTYSEVEYGTALLNTVNGRLLNMVSGMSTGLTPQVENAIWERARARQNKALRAKADAALKTFASRGFRLPGGVAQRVIDEILREQLDGELTLNREVMIKQAELEQSNLQFSVQYAISLEGQLIQHFNSVQSRGLEAFKLTVSSRIELFNAEVRLYNADVQAFSARAEAFKTALQGELAKLEIFKAQIEGQRAVGALNESIVKMYASRVEAVGKVAELYKTQVESAGLLMQNEATKIAAYKATVEAAQAKVQAKTAEIQGYSERVKAEVAKTEMFSQQAGAYKSRVDAYSALVNARIATQVQKFKEIAEFPLQVYDSQVKAYQSAIGAEASRIGALAQVYESKIRGYVAHEQAKVGNNQVSIQEFEALIRAATAQATAATDVAKVKLTASEQEYETTQTSIRAVAQIAGQIASAALSMLNINASSASNESNNVGQSYGLSVSTSDSSSNSRSYSEIHSYTED